MTHAIPSTVSMPSRRWVFSALLAAFFSIAIAALMFASNPRTLVSWHGFLHSAIANRFPGPFATPENPFFAGERLPYYWLHQSLASLLARGLGVHPIVALQVLTAAGLLGLWLGSVAIGAYRLRSRAAGLLIGFLVLAGVNPLGPAIAVAKHIVLDQPLFDRPEVGARDEVFATEHDSAHLLTQPLLSALYVGGDWRRGQNVPWYLDSSSRGLALGLLPVLLFGITGATWSVARAVAIAAIAAAIGAVNPLIGVAAVGAIGGGSILLVAWRRLRAAGSPDDWVILGSVGSAVVGLLVAGPTFIHLFRVGGSGLIVLGLRGAMVREMAIAANIVVLLPLAIAGAVVTRGLLGDYAKIIVFGACALLLVVPFIVLTDDTDHNFLNTAQALLAFPAVAYLVSRRARAATYVLVAMIFVPMTAATLSAYMWRPSLPIRFEGELIHRTDPAALEGMYTWIRGATPADAVFIASPVTPVKMSGNVAELPSFTRRTMFVDAASYLTSPHRDFDRRIAVATRLSSGATPTNEDAAYLRALNRPIYLVVYDADRDSLANALIGVYGPPLFRRDFVAVFDLGPTVRRAD